MKANVLRRALEMVASFEDICGAAALARLREESSVAHGLPRAAYTSEDFLKLEYERLFARAWTFVGFAHEIPEPGDGLPASVAGQPILLLRNSAGEFKAFHNVCRHRGHTVVPQPCRGVRALVCPYHGWTYDLDGRLKRTPHFGGYGKMTVEGFSPDQHGLKPVRCSLWHDWLFVNLDSSAPPLEGYVAPVAKRLEDLDFDKMKPVAKLDLGTVHANWKLLIENYIEPYHVPVVHRQSAGGQPLADHYMIVDGECVGCAIDVSSRRRSSDKPEPVENQRTDMLDMSTRYLTLFPNFVFGWYLPDQVGVHLNVPEAPDRTRQWRVIYQVGDETPSAVYIERLCALWRQVHHEDHAIVEGLQAGRASSVMDDGGLLSPHWETSVRQFHRLVVDALV